MDAKTILIGLIIGIVIGAGVGYIMTPSPDVSSYEDEISQLESHLELLQNQYSQLQDDYEKLKSDYQDVQQELENAITKSEYDKLQNQVTQLQSQINSLQTQISAKNNIINGLQEKIEEYERILPPAPPAEGEPGSSRFFPADIGTNLTSVFEYAWDEYTATVILKEVIRGAEAWTMIKNANMFNDPPPEGYEYVLVRIYFKYLSGPSIDKTFDVSDYDFDAISSEGYEYESPMVVSPEPSIDATLYPGASHEGWVTFQIYETDEKPVLAFGREYDGTGGIWYKLYQES